MIVGGGVVLARHSDGVEVKNVNISNQLEPNKV
jgi:hypothetical protein